MSLTSWSCYAVSIHHMTTAVTGWCQLLRRHLLLQQRSLLVMLEVFWITELLLVRLKFFSWGSARTRIRKTTFMLASWRHRGVHLYEYRVKIIVKESELKLLTSSWVFRRCSPIIWLPIWSRPPMGDLLFLDAKLLLGIPPPWRLGIEAEHGVLDEIELLLDYLIDYCY